MKKISFRIVTLSLAAMSFFTPSMSAIVSEPVIPASGSSVPANEDNVGNALNEFKSLSRKERKSRIKEVKKMVSQYKADKRAGKSSDDRIILLVILAILLPPLAVYLKEEEINTKFWISLILTLLFWIPGVVYALLVVFDVI